jgi:NAD(P)-dependent dehydrogenase (short-subunit alcohol dehydrogenase family)
MLDPELPLEPGLGSDSITLMEIFSALKPYHQILADPDQDDEEVLAQFVELKSLGAIRDHYARRRAEILEGGGEIPAPESDSAAEETPEAEAAAPVVASTSEVAETAGNGKPVDRLVVRSVRSEPLTDCDLGPDALRFSKQHVLLLVGDAHEYGPVLKAALGRGGYPVFQLLPGKQLRRLGDRRYEADLDRTDSLAALSEMVRSECGVPVGGIINLLGLDPQFREPGLAASDAPLKLAVWLLNLAKTFETQILESIEAGGGLLVNLTSLDGHFGLSESRPLPVAQAASTGFFKALAKEWRGVRVKNIDIDPDGEPGVLLTALLAEMARWDDLAEVGLSAQGRWSVDLVEEAPTQPAEAAESIDAWTDELAIDSDSVVLATGGARGITAEVLRLLAAETGARLVIVGRSPFTPAEDEPEELRALDDAAALRTALIRMHGSGRGTTPAEIEHEVQTLLKNRAIRKNLESFSDAGSTVEYHAVDVRDEQALASLVEDVYKRHGRIDGVIHAAGVVEDKRLRDKTIESFERVFQTKVQSALVLARTLRPEQLKFLAFFSSLSGRFGNAGQSDYSAANECLNKLADHLDHEWPCRVVAMNWGPWDGGLISEALRKAYVQRGIDLISTLAGSKAFFAELGRREANAPEVVLACNAREIGRADAGLPDA